MGSGDLQVMNTKAMIIFTVAMAILIWAEVTK